jgi:pyruvate formate-lyase activating enzyme-like uncharacterized protein
LERENMSRWTSDFTGSFYNDLPRGCEICKMGASLVLFITGICERSCFYCPLSSARKNRDVIFANESEAEGIEDILEEGRAIGALGTGITGGEPLLKPDLVIKAIKALKGEFGSDHHIHLYTGTMPDSALLKKLREAGLGEIRIHPPHSEWSNPAGLEDLLCAARSLGLDAGVEIPAIEPAPKIVEAVKRSGAFLNLNELEFSDTNQEDLKIRGFKANDMDCGAEGSEQVAKEFFMDEEARIHYCSSRFKDAVQLRERLKRRSQRVSRLFDIPTDDGTLIFGTITGEEKDLGNAISILEKLGVAQDMYSLEVDRIEIAGWILEEFSKELKSIGLTLALVERYPLEKGPVVERIPL